MLLPVRPKTLNFRCPIPAATVKRYLIPGLLLSVCLFLFTPLSGQPIVKQDSLLEMARGSLYQDIEKTLSLSQQLLQRAIDEQNPRQEAEAYELLGKLYHFYGLYAQALEYKNKALAIARELDDKTFLADCLNSVGVSWRALQQIDFARSHLLQAYHINDSLQDTLGICKNLTNLALINKEEGKLTDAKILLRKSLWLSEHASISQGIAINLLNLGNLYDQTKYFSKAENFYRQALAVASKNDNQQIILFSHQRIAELLLKINRTKEGQLHLQQATHMAATLNAGERLLDLKLLAAKYALTEQNWQLASQHYAGYIDTNQKRNQRDDSLRYVHLNRLHQADEYLKDQQLLQAKLSLRENELQLARASEKQSQIIFIAEAVLLSVLFFFSLAISKLYFSKRKANAELQKLAREVAEQKEALAKANTAIQKQNDVLEEQVEERTRQLQLQNKQLKQYAYFNAHKVRGPLARILGLLNLMQMETDLELRSKVIDRLQESGAEMDQVLTEINEVLHNP